MNAEQLPYWLALNSIPRLSGKRLNQLLEFFHNDAALAWQNGRAWPEALGAPAAAAAEILEAWGRLDPARLYAEFLNDGCSAVALADAEYPPALAAVYDPPPLLFYRGRLPDPADICLALIGSRRSTAYGEQVAEIFSRDLAGQGMVVVSGMARGIDSICHRGALKAGGRTVAVLGSGLDVIYPRENSRLYAEICESGAVISEFPLGAAALAANFPRRNRIISGLSRGVVVIEAGEKSGTLLTVDYALQQGRDVFAVPGPVTSPWSKGTNKLLKDGCQMALCAEDIRSYYIHAPARPLQPGRAAGAGPGLSALDRRLLELLITPRQIDELSACPGLELDSGALAAALTMLEIRGLVRQLPGKYYQTVVKHIIA